MLSSKLKNLIQNGSITCYKVGRSTIPISHLFYADDILVFTYGAERSLMSLKQLLQVYERSSGQMVNLTKSGYYIDDKYSCRIPVIFGITGMQRGILPFKYLGVPIVRGRCKAVSTTS